MKAPIRLFLPATAFLAVATTHAVAQPSIGRGLHGRVVAAADSSPIPGAIIDVGVAGAAAPVARVYTNDAGQFRVTGLEPGRYYLIVRRIGYARHANLDVTVDSADVGVGTIVLTAALYELQSVAVTERRQDVQLAPDRSTYVVRDMPTAKGGSALDVLRSVPSVDVDIDNVVSLRGNTGVTVQINGRPSALKAAQLGDFLAQLPAAMVDRVEIVPNPSARDDPTGVAGIINIVLKEEADAGTSGGATLSGSTTGLANLGLNAGYDHKGLTLYGSYGFLRDRRSSSETLFRENAYELPLTYLDEHSIRAQTRQVHTLTASAGYELSPHDELSLDLFASTRHDDESRAITYRALDARGALAGLSDRLTAGTNQENDFDGAFALKHAFAAKGHHLTVEVRAARHNEGGPSEIAAHALALDGTALGATEQDTQRNLERPEENAIKVDYVRPIATSVRVEVGYKGAFDHFHTALDTRLLDTASGVYLPDDSRTSDFVYRQDVNAGYGMLVGQRGKLQLQAGLRVEHASTEFQVATVSGSFVNSYDNVFPSGLLAYDIDDATQVKIGYSARIRRPDDADLLDPIPHYADPLNLSRGNPFLKPEHTSAFELGAQRIFGRTMLQLAPFFRRTFDAVRALRTIDTAGVTTRTFANVATSDAYGGDVTLTRNGTQLSGFIGGSLFRQTSDAHNVAPELSTRTFGWRARANATYRVSSATDVQALFTYQAPMTVEQGTTASRTQLNLAARRKLMQDRLSLTLRVIDPFSTASERGTTIDPRFVLTSDRRRAIRGLLVSASWTFGKPRKEKESIDLSSDAAP